MKITDEMKAKIRQAVVTYLQQKGSASRVELMDGATALLGLSVKEMEDSRATGKYQTLRSYVGVAVDVLASEGAVTLFEHRYTVAEESVVTVKASECRAAIKALLAEATYTKTALFKALDARFGSDRTPTRKDDAMIHSIAGSILSELAKSGEVVSGENGYSLGQASKRPSNRTLPLEAFKKEFHTRLCRMGGPFFEHFTANLLEKYYTMTGRTVLVCEVAGGSSDGGIDVIVDTQDGLGFFEHILIQCKCRERAHVTEKEVREFYGAMTAREGSRGIYATTSVFHYGAQKLLDSLDNCVGIDGEKLFELVDKTSYGIIKTRTGYRFDEAIFTK